MPVTVAHPTPAALPYTPRAWNATYHTTWGQCLLTADGHVYFVTGETRQWRELVDADLPYIHRHGRLDVIAEAALFDALHGNLYQQVIYRHQEHARVAA